MAEENYILAEADYMDGMKYKDIAAKYNVAINTVKSWKQRYGWSKDKKVCTQKPKKVRTQKKYAYHAEDDGTKETMNNPLLTDKERLFCLYYAKSYNATQSYLKAYGCSYDIANAEGYKKLVKPCIKDEIERLKEIKRQQIVCDEADIVEYHMRIAFADMGDYVAFGHNEKANIVSIKDSAEVDTQLIQEVKSGKNGVSIKLKDAHRSLEWLDKYFICNPYDRHKIEYEKCRQELEKSKLELEIAKFEHEMDMEEITVDDQQDDNMLEQLINSAKALWKVDDVKSDE